MGLEGIMLNEISHKKEKYCVFSQSKAKQNQTVDYNKRETDSPVNRIN